MARVLSGMVGVYQLALRPMLPPACRFVPSCSEYYREALRSHGIVRATVLAVRRIGRCHPWHEGGYDPPPPGRMERRSKPSA
jgi:putative membrane protein insertion efficiency factor